MTQERRDGHSTEFGLWLRRQREIDSKLGYVATNLDFIWSNYRTGAWMILEEKRYGQQPRRYQLCLFWLLDKVAPLDPNYRGFHLLTFQKTCPEDGEVFLDDRLIGRDELVEFLQFRLPVSWYHSYRKLKEAA